MRDFYALHDTFHEVGQPRSTWLFPPSGDTAIEEKRLTERAKLLAAAPVKREEPSDVLPINQIVFCVVFWSWLTSLWDRFCALLFI